MLKKYNEIWNKIKILLKKEFDKKPVCDNKYISAKVNGTEFEHRILKDNERCNISLKPKNGSRHEYLSLILLDSILFIQAVIDQVNIISKYFLKNAYTQKINKQNY